MDPQDIMNFAKLLRDNGDKVLNADFKLTLSGNWKLIEIIVDKTNANIITFFQFECCKH